MLNILTIILLGLICYYIYKFFKLAENVQCYVKDIVSSTVPIQEVTDVFSRIKSLVKSS